MKTTFLTLLLGFIGFTGITQPHTFSHRTQNNHEIILLAEGQGRMNYSVLIGLTPEIFAETMPDSTYQSATNVFLVRKTTGKHVLIDAGLGIRVVENLQKFGVTPEMIDKILITHLHFDHIGGLLDSNNAKAFPNALLYVPKNDYVFFTDPSSTLNERWREIATAVVNTYRENLVLFPPEQEIMTDVIQALPNFGHTPGHTVFVVDNDILIWGDMVHSMAVQMPHPTVSTTFDVDNQMAIKARLTILEYIISNNLSVGGAHIPFPGMGSLTPNGKGGFIFTPKQ
ncbi:MAG: MBL fold metallo-hydrolase [Bacteroidales bacterium]|nr:MBL fold metallo-hydrolase [Bacteroidales bacterium]